jgi:hypothetical protein
MLGILRIRYPHLAFIHPSLSIEMDPTLAQGAGLAIEDAYHLGKTFQDSQSLSKYLSPHHHSNLDFDEIMPELIECENSRYSFFFSHS